MSIININSYKTISDIIEPRLDKVKGRLRCIDPAILGESRYTDEHWLMTKKVFDLLFFLKWLICYPLVRKWDATRGVLEAQRTDLETVKAKIRRIDPELLGESTGVLRVFYFIQRQVFRWSLISLGKELEKQLGQVQCAAITFAELPITNEQKVHIRKLTYLGANESISSLIKNSNKLMAAKRKLNFIHPLKWFEFMLKDAECLESLKTLSESPERWIGITLVAGFRTKLAERFRRYAHRGSLLPYLPDFFKSVGLNSSQANSVMSFANQDKWAEVIQALVDFKKGSSCR